MQAGAGRRGGDEAVSQEGKTPTPRSPHKRRSWGGAAHQAGRQEQNTESRVTVTRKWREAGEGERDSEASAVFMFCWA